ncbi:MAG: ribbon-helix-helix domain-containing protein [Limisphaerales bacterium]
MKMDTMNISLPKSMSEFVRQNVERNYGNASEYIRDLLREKMRQQIEADVKFLESSMKGARRGPSEAEIDEILKLQKKVRKELNARRV